MLGFSVFWCTDIRNLKNSVWVSKEFVKELERNDTKTHMDTEHLDNKPCFTWHTLKMFDKYWKLKYWTDCMVETLNSLIVLRWGENVCVCGQIFPTGGGA